MITNLTAEDLIAFEDDIAQAFRDKQIRTIIHLYSGGEENMLSIFQDVHPADWVMCSWRSHYQCLLKGVPPAELKAEILAGRSIALCFPEYNIVSSGIVGGILPIAVGVAMGIKRCGAPNRVHCFLGDMTSETGIAHECMKYSQFHSLPITFYVEDNRKSVCTDTRDAWGMQSLTVDQNFSGRYGNTRVVRYEMEKFPHAGAGERIQF